MNENTLNRIADALEKIADALTTEGVGLAEVFDDVESRQVEAIGHLAAAITKKTFNTIGEL